MKPQTTLLTSLVLLASFATSSVQADPRWWWDDRQVAPPREDRQWPHLAGGGGQGGGEGGGLFLVFSEWDPVDGDWEVYLTSTPNLGCEWCEPVRLTDNAVDDVRPRVASAILPDGSYSIQVIFDQAGDAVVAHDAVMSAWDPPEEFCANLAGVGPRIIANSQYLTLNSVAGTASFPDITVGSLFGGFNHFHAVWQDERLPGESDIFAARDISGLGGANWGAELLLTPGSAPHAMAQGPTVSADIFTTTAGESAVNLAYVESDASEVRFLRSVDSGLTWTSVGAPTGSLADAGGTPAGRPALDSGKNPWSVDTPVWQCAAWEDHSGVDPELFADAQFNDAPLTATPSWDKDELLRTTSAPGVADPTVSIVESRIDGNPVHIFWTDPREGQDEIFHRGGQLSTTALIPMDFSVPPFAPQRAMDLSVSENLLMTHCSVDEASLDCLSDRTLGNAGQSSTEADFMATWVVWRDTRDGVGNIYFKRSDEYASGTFPTLSTQCSDLSTAEVSVEWSTPQNCANSFWGNEHLLRYLVYYGTDQGGPYINAASPIEVTADPFAMSQGLTIGGLTPGETYSVIVVTEDEARNLTPPDFDPTDNNGTPFNEATITTPVLCAPTLDVACTLLSDRCPSNASLNDDGQADFNEFIDLQLAITNNGTMMASNYTATVQGGIGTIVLPVGGAVNVDSLDVGETVLVDVTVQLPAMSAASCGDPVGMSLTAQQSDAGTFTYADDPLASCALTIGQPSPPCSECAAAALVVLENSTLVSDACLVDPMGPGAGNGAIDPRERVSIDLSFRNIGGLAAADFVGTVSISSGGSLVSGGTVGPVTVPAGEAALHSLVVDVAAGCGELLVIDLSGMTSDSGSLSYPDESIADHRVGSELAEVVNTHVDSSFLWFVDGGEAVEGFAGVTVSAEPLVDSVIFRITNSSLVDPDDTRLTLVGPGGSLDVSAAMSGDLDITAEYNSVLGGAGDYVLRAQDEVADASGDSWIGSWELVVTDWDASCDACGSICLFRSTVADRLDFTPLDIYLGARLPNGIGVQGAPHFCEIVSGDRDGSAVDGSALMIYQVDDPSAVLRLTRQGDDIQFDF